jgi:hypothetical protein
MRDWKMLVQERLHALGCTAQELEEIVSEIAGHLEDAFEIRRELGQSETEAFAGALEEVPDWDALRRKIQYAKREEGNMNHRTKAIWLPGLASLAATMGFLMALQLMHVQPHIFWLPLGTAFLVYVPWFLLLPFLGAAGAYWSSRAGARPAQRLVAGLFPSIGLTVMLIVMFAGAMVVDRQVPAHVKLVGMAVFVSNWIVLPALALLLGVLPFLRVQRPRPAN